MMGEYPKSGDNSNTKGSTFQHMEIIMVQMCRTNLGDVHGVNIVKNLEVQNINVGTFMGNRLTGSQRG